MGRVLTKPGSLGNGSVGSGPQGEGGYPGSTFPLLPGPRPPGPPGARRPPSFLRLIAPLDLTDTAVNTQGSQQRGRV